MTSERAVLLDVQPHNTWALNSFLEILLRTSPSDLGPFELRGVIPSRSSFSADEILELRKAGMSSPYNICGRAFLPALGLSTSGHATRIVRFVMTLLRTISNSQKLIQTNQLAPQAMKKLAERLTAPVRLGLRLEGAEFLIYDKERAL